MFKRLFGFGGEANRSVTDAIYGQIVASARQPCFYSRWNVPDTPLGRYEMVSLHLFLFLHRVRGDKGPVRDLAQEVADEFFRDVEHSIRELGIGDMGVPKRMKKLARMFYGRIGAYEGPLDNGDTGTLAAALNRNIRPDDGAWPDAQALAAYVFAAEAGLRAQTAETILSGKIAFPEPGPHTVSEDAA